MSCALALIAVQQGCPLEMLRRSLDGCDEGTRADPPFGPGRLAAATLLQTQNRRFPSFSAAGRNPSDLAMIGGRITKRDLAGLRFGNGALVMKRQA
jgi:hypothetical protein